MEKNSLTKKHLDLLDYSIIISFMIFPLTIGVYYAYKQRKGTTVLNYLLADRKMKYLAIAMSSFSTMISSSTFIGLPVELYLYGSITVWHYVAELLTFPLYTQVFAPIFVNLNSYTMFTYFKVRYNTIMWKTCSAVSIISMLFSLSITISATSNVFMRVIGIDMWTSSVVIAVLCITYTTVGGMKAVIWTDFFQGIVIIVTILLIIVVGTIYAGGFSNVWTTSLKGNRLDIFNTKFNLTDRHTMWSSLFAYFMFVMAHQVGNQQAVQRYLAAKDLKTAQKATKYGLGIKLTSTFVLLYVGLMIYTVNSKCDPVTGLGLHHNQVVPDFIMKTFGPYPGFPGLFIAGLISAVLSTMSSILNALSAVTIQDACGSFIKNMTENNKVILCQVLVVFYGTVSIFGLYIIQLFSNVYQASFVLQSITASIVTLILIGAFLPQVNTKAVMIGFSCGLTVSVWLAVGNLLYGQKPPTQPMDISECHLIKDINKWINSTESYTSKITPWNFTDNVKLTTNNYNEGLWAIYDISGIWFTFFNVFITLITSYLFTFILGVESNYVNCMHLIPPAVQKLHHRLPKTARKIFLCDIYDDVNILNKEKQLPEVTQLTILKTEKNGDN